MVGLEISFGVVSVLLVEDLNQLPLIISCSIFFHKRVDLVFQVYRNINFRRNKIICINRNNETMRWKIIHWIYLRGKWCHKIFGQSSHEEHHQTMSLTMQFDFSVLFQPHGMWVWIFRERGWESLSSLFLTQYIFRGDWSEVRRSWFGLCVLILTNFIF